MAADEAQPYGCPPIPHPAPLERLFPCPGSSPSRPPVSTPTNSPRPPVALGSKGQVLKVKPPRSTRGQARDTPAPSLPESHCVRPHLLFSHKVIRPRARLSHAGSPVKVPGLGSPDSPSPAATPRHTQQRHEDRGHRGATATPSGLGATGLSPGRISTWTLWATWGAGLGLAPRSVPP